MLWRNCLQCGCVGAWRNRVKWGNVINTAIKGGKRHHGIVKSVHRKVLSSTEENVRTLTVWRVPYCLANLAGKHMFRQKQESLSVHLSPYTDRHLLKCLVDNKPKVKLMHRSRQKQRKRTQLARTIHNWTSAHCI